MGIPSIEPERLDVSRETLEALRPYVDLLARWNTTINLVSAASLQDAWNRHVVDSAQLWRLIRPGVRVVVDLGSGGGFPALVLAHLAKCNGVPMDFHLVESDGRKVAFLLAALRELSLDASVHNSRLEAAVLPTADLITARAFAPLADLVRYALRYRHPQGQALFLKGRSTRKELDDARTLWDFEYRLHRSLTDPEASVVEIGEIYGCC